MRRALLCLFAFAGLLGLPAKAEEVVLGLSSDEVAITTTFDGSSLLIFGAIKRDAPLPEGDPMEVVMTVAGPPEPVDIRRKARRFGIWVNAETVHITKAPTFYAVASTAPLSEVLSNTEDIRQAISMEQAIRTIGTSDDAADTRNFLAALVRIRSDAGLYQIREGDVQLDEQTLFRASFDLPANLTEGAYDTRIFLLRGGAVVDAYETVIDVRKVGLERWLYTLAYQKPLAYGILSLTIAILAGWLASAAFRLFQR